MCIIHGDEDTLGDFEPARVKTTRFGDARGRARAIQDYARVFFVFFVGDSSG